MKTLEKFKSEIKELRRLDSKDGLSEYGTTRLEALEDYENLILFGVNRSNRINTVNNFLDIANKIVENTRAFGDGKTYTKLAELPTVIANKYEIIKK